MHIQDDRRSTSSKVVSRASRSVADIDLQRKRQLQRLPRPSLQFVPSSQPPQQAWTPTAMPSEKFVSFETWTNDEDQCTRGVDSSSIVTCTEFIFRSMSSSKELFAVRLCISVDRLRSFVVLNWLFSEIFLIS